MRITPARWLSLIVVPFALAGAAQAAGACKPGALGVSRTVVVDPREYGRIGTMNYVHTLPLADKEVVLTFDDGPLPPYSDRVLDVLAAECVRATFFVVGRMARANPARVRRAHAEGHSIATHSMNHPIPFRTRGLDVAKAEIEGGIEAVGAALGDAKALAPFFRFPGLGRTPAVEGYLDRRGLMVWSADVPSDDWRRIGASEIVRRSLSRLEAKGKGILLMHDIQPATALALPVLLSELKARGYRIVHVQPAAEGRTKTATAPQDWLPRRRARWRLPAFAVADIRAMDGAALMGRDADERCRLAPAEPALHAFARASRSLAPQRPAAARSKLAPYVRSHTDPADQ